MALPIFPVRLQTSIVGRSELNFRVRNGNGWTLALISTNFVDADSVSFAATQALRLVHFIASPLPHANALPVCARSVYAIRLSPVNNLFIFLSHTLRTSPHLSFCKPAKRLQNEKRELPAPTKKPRRQAGIRAIRAIRAGDPYRIRTDVNGVRGRCLNHLTNGPFGTPSGTRTLDTLIKSQVLYQLS